MTLLSRYFRIAEFLLTRVRIPPGAPGDKRVSVSADALFVFYLGAILDLHPIEIDLSRRFVLPLVAHRLPKICNSCVFRIQKIDRRSQR